MAMAVISLNSNSVPMGGYLRIHADGKMALARPAAATRQGRDQVPKPSHGVN